MRLLGLRRRRRGPGENNDRLDDLLMGAPNHNGSTGAAYPVLSMPSGTTDHFFADARILRENAGDQLGISLASAGGPAYRAEQHGYSMGPVGDADGDGPDVCIATLSLDAGATTTSAVHLMLGYGL